jgi:hypothetical protein
MLAPVIMGYIGREKQQNNVGAGGLGDLLGEFLGMHPIRLSNSSLIH